MNFIALGFALPAALHNPWLHGAALVVLLVCLPRLLGIVYIPHTQVGIIEKIWSSKGSLRDGQIIARNGEAGYQARSYVAVFTSDYIRGNTAFIRNRSSL